MKLRLGLLGTAAAIAVAAACSSSSTSPGGTGNTGADSGGPDDSSVGTTPPNDGAVATAPPIMCGTMTCNAPAGGVVPLSPCCLPNGGCGGTIGAATLAMFDAGGFDASGLSGFDAGAICLDTSAGTPDTSCPSQSMGGFDLTGCCTASGVCGIDLSLAGLGCESLSALASMAPPGALGDSGLGGPPQACGAAVDGGGASDASEAGAAPQGGDAGDGSVP
jgi:hypothetical protein